MNLGLPNIDLNNISFTSLLPSFSGGSSDSAEKEKEEARRTRSMPHIFQESPEEQLVYGWCSWCYKYTAHGLVQAALITRNVYKCTDCSGRTLCCRWAVSACPGMARGHEDWDDEQCAVCDGLLEQWGFGGPRPQAGYCSWCYRHTNHHRMQTLATNVVECALHQGQISDWALEESNREAARQRGEGHYLKMHDPFESYAPERPNIKAIAYIDGKDFYEAAADSIEAAEKEIFMSWWHFSTFVHMKREISEKGGELPDRWRIDNLLRRKAKQGVKIYVILWDETDIAMRNFSKDAQANLLSLHPSIKCIRHPPFRPLFWTHHQKFIVVDRKIAYVGGFDICLGRYDDQHHRLVDPDSKTWPGIDYYNPHYLKPATVDTPFEDVLERDKVPRMPWHDVSVSVDGAAAGDVASNFIQRWNHHIQSLPALDPSAVPIEKSPPNPQTDGGAITITTIRRRRSSAPQRLGPQVIVGPEGATGTTVVRCIRSVSEWSAGVRTEASIYGAYMSAIKNAEHYIYVENQYLSSSLAGGGVENKLMQAIMEKIEEKIHKKENFRVIFVLPQPETRDFQELRGILKWQYQTINRGGHSILEQLKERYPSIDHSKYISFYFLRNYDFINAVPVTEKVFVHAKLMIVDDQIAIISSANFNDRSMLGDRDSELGVEVRDASTVSGLMDGKQVEAACFAKDLRLRLWQEHLGLGADDLACIEDPVSDATYFGVWMATAKANTHIYETVFPGVLSSDIKTWEKFEESWDIPPRPPFELLENIRGYLTIHPIGFLSDDTMDTLNATFLGVDLYQ